MSIAQRARPRAVPAVPVEDLHVADAHSPPQETGRESKDLASPTSVRDLDRAFRSGLARLTGGLAPSALAGAFFDWAVHLAASPGKQLELAAQVMTAAAENAAFASRCARGGGDDPCRCALPQDNRFRAAEWRTFPFNVYAHSFLAIERWWEQATTGVRGVSKQHEDAVTFAARQVLDTAAPSNFIWTNPAALERTASERGMNLVRGFANLAEDMRRAAADQGPVGTEAFQVGKTVAVTPGKVVHRTPLAEVIQYSPSTDRVRPEPIVIVPAWIMKYYILDLSPANSLVRVSDRARLHGLHDLVEEPGPEDRDVGFEDYRTRRPLAALEAATAITGAEVHGVGYCLGGTLLADHRRRHGARSATTVLRALSLPRRPGRLHRGGRADAVHQREPGRLPRGYDVGAWLSRRQADVGAFQLLRSNDLIWSRVVRDYLMGERSTPIDIMAWNADTTRMPYRMHSEYLRALFLDNDLAEGRFKVERAADRAARYSRPGIRRRHRAGPRRALAVGVQVPRSRRCRSHLCADQWRAQCGHRVRAGPRASAFPDRLAPA